MSEHRFGSARRRNCVARRARLSFGATLGETLEGRTLLSIAPVITKTGFITLSTDAVGTNSGPTVLRVQKPAGATVESAYLLAATTPFGGTIPDGQISLNGTPVTFSDHVHSPGGENNYFTDVTSIVKSTIDAAPAGLSTIPVDEGNDTSNIDGEILAVIFNDPNQATSNTVVLLFGAQDSAGDTFAIGLANPIDKTDPNLLLDMSLGISFGFQSPNNGSQFSFVNVNGQRMTSSAGGQDDGQDENGALITVGGIGDTNANPDPNASVGPAGDRTDDELYDLRPFVNNGDTSINVFTQNPSNDDNIFFAALNLHSATAVVGEGILLSPVTDTQPVGGTATVNAMVQDTLGNPIANRSVTFTIDSGPDAGLTFTTMTNASGDATFTYNGAAAGTDSIHATFLDDMSHTITSNVVTRTFTVANAPEVVSVQVDDGTAQRSMVRSLDVTFNQVVTFDPNAFVLTLPSGAQPVTVNVTSQVVGDHTVAHLTFSGLGILANSLEDGRYVLTVQADKVHNGDGVGLASDYSTKFFRFFGDSNGDAVVDASDYNAFRAAYLSHDAVTYAIYDYNGDGSFTLADLKAFTINYTKRRLP